jgi:magnesium chelatase family protein
MAANTRPCGRLGAVFADESGKEADSGCFCSGDEIRRYWRKMGSALLDRIDLRVPVRSQGALAGGGEKEENSAEIRKRVIAAVEIQRERFKESNLVAEQVVRRNSRMSPGQIEKFCPLTKKAGEAFILAATKLGLSGRACHGIRKIARTIADLEGKESLDTAHILEAIQHRRLGDDPYDILGV